MEIQHILKKNSLSTSERTQGIPQGFHYNISIHQNVYILLQDTYILEFSEAGEVWTPSHSLG